MTGAAGEGMDGADGDDVADGDELVDGAAVAEVAHSEAALIAMARALVEPASADPWRLLSVSRTMPDEISPACARVLRDALAHAWPALWRRGAVAGERPWRRSEPVGLTFLAPTLELLRWLAGTPLGAPSASRPLVRAPRGVLAVGDQVACYLALALAEHTPAQAAIAAQPLVRAAPLAWLGFADVLGPAAGFEFGALLADPAGPLVVAALAAELGRRWAAVELGKRAATEAEPLVALGAAQDATLQSWLTACDRAGRRDLGGFVLAAAARALARGLSPDPTLLDRRAPLALRSEARVAAGALLRGVARWTAWDQQHRGVRFIDDEYAATQRLLAQFEVVGRAGADLAARWLAELASF